MEELRQCKTAQLVDGQELKIIPILLDVTIKELPLFLRQINCVDTKIEIYCSDRTKLYDRIWKAVVAEYEPLSWNNRTAERLALRYYQGYLSRVMPTFRERLMKSKCWLEEGAVKGNMSTRFIILCPESGQYHTCFVDDDSRLELLPAGESSLEPISLTLGASTVQYHQRVCRITLDNGETFFAVANDAMSILSLFEIPDDGLSGLEATDRLCLQMVFQEALEQVLYCFQMESAVFLLKYDDTKTPHQQYPIAELLVETIKEEVAARRRE